MNTPPSPATTLAALVSPRRDWVVAGIAFVVGTCAFVFIFHAECASAVNVWSNSYAYNHCFLVLPVAAYLAWDRRAAAWATVPRSEPWIALLALPAAAAWFAADRLGIMEARQLTAMALFQILVLALLGWRSWRALSAPFLYLFFLVPFGEFFVPPLQKLVVHFATTGLELLGIPVYTSGTVIEIPEGAFEVEDVCAGLRFLTAMAAFGVPYVCLAYRSPLRRALFFAVFLGAAIIGNCFRVLGTLLIAHFTANVQLVEADHTLWGWAFYLLIGAIVAVIGMVFRQERSFPVRTDAPVSRSTAGASAIALSVIVLLAAAPRVAANYLDQFGKEAATAAQITPPALAGCETVSASTPAPSAADEYQPAAGISGSVAYRCDGDLFVLTLTRFPPRVSARALFSLLHATETPPDAVIIRQSDKIAVGTEPRSASWRVTESEKDGVYAIIATALWLDGHPAVAGMTARVNQALNAVRPSPLSPVIAVVAHPRQHTPNIGWAAIERFLAKTTPISQLVNELLSTRSVR
jgi:exosortase A